MTAYADLDVSVIDELPPGRTPVRTVVLPDTRRGEMVQRIEAACRSGRQAYWVCPLIDESDDGAAPGRGGNGRRARGGAAGRAHRAGARPHAGRRARTPSWRRSSRASSTCWSPRPSSRWASTCRTRALMVIENAERMGLSQLHQLRGRVGRGVGGEQLRAALSAAPLAAIARERLAVLRDTNDGFEVARRDLELRGPGELLGTRQTGLMQLTGGGPGQGRRPAARRCSERPHLMLGGPGANIVALLRRWVGEGGALRQGLKRPARRSMRNATDMDQGIADGHVSAAADCGCASTRG